MNLQGMIAQAQKMQKEINKAMAELANEEFVVSKNGIVEVTLLGDKTVKSIHIDDDAFDSDPESKAMVEESIALALTEGLTKIKEREDEIQSSAANKYRAF